MFGSCDLQCGVLGSCDLQCGVFGSGDLQCGVFGSGDLQCGVFGSCDLQCGVFGSCDLQCGVFWSCDLQCEGVLLSSALLGLSYWKDGIVLVLFILCIILMFLAVFQRLHTQKRIDCFLEESRVYEKELNELKNK